jgi:ERF superfamily
MSETKKVYAAIAHVMRTMAKEGISKDRKNLQQGYNFRSIDDFFNSLAPALVDAQLCILPNVVSREVVERESAKKTALFYVTVKVDFAFVSAEDGSEHHVVTYGEAMDSGDKATNKAMSTAYKYAAMQAFSIPTEGDNDADATTHEVQARRLTSEELASVTIKLEEAAKIGTAALVEAWNSIPPFAKSQLVALKDALKTRASVADENQAAVPPHDEPPAEASVHDAKIADWCAALEAAPTLDDLKTCFGDAKGDVESFVTEQQVQRLVRSKNKRARELVAAGNARKEAA